MGIERKRRHLAVALASAAQRWAIASGAAALAAACAGSDTATWPGGGAGEDPTGDSTHCIEAPCPSEELPTDSAAVGQEAERATVVCRLAGAPPGVPTLTHSVQVGADGGLHVTLLVRSGDLAVAGHLVHDLGSPQRGTAAIGVPTPTHGEVHAEWQGEEPRTLWVYSTGGPEGPIDVESADCEGALP